MTGEIGERDAATEVGAVLRAAREARGAVLTDCAAALRARSDQLQRLEAGDLGGFGGEVYARGFIRSYARLLGVDPAPLLARLGAGPGATGVQHLRELPTERLPAQRGVPAWAVALVLLVVGGAIVAGALRLGGARTPDAAPVPAAPPPTAADPAEPADPATPAPAPVPERDPVAPVALVLTLEAPSWLEVVADGVAVEPGRTVPAGETLTFSAQRAIIARFGNAGGVRAELNGADLGPQGTPGQVVRVGYGPDGVLDALPTGDATG